MQALLRLSRGIDGLNAWVGKYVIWLILAATVVSGVNAVVRKVFHTSSNAFLEVQWYFFAASFLLAAGYTLLEKEHVKVDVINARLSLRTRVWIDVLGFALFLTPMCGLVLYYGVPFFLQAWNTGEMSSNAGGLIRWPVYLMMPLGFGLLLLQGLSELIKRIAFLMGLIDDPTVKIVEKTPEEELAEVIRKAEEEAARNAAKSA
ncbi:TRAP transporter small permease subunit [Comamonas aquatica]|uniref:TRAP transporter small permease protein n=1 Tax=Comamonas aquatica TaxID=225991 RepID=A0AA42W1B0_9BURK|nr:TRAP transporter small permease subunit [Comamonas aquatica]MDH1427829.1 TRAP transporter small permease subunit [Comamonas aquatica]MDH1605816.1 TRAP transporter small permease subunit [Comamonas aquatica]MDH1616496.1 TRAP transporter small permease subunit [Comamonas aquatica]MDH2004354.1 TRAP transporter small permease subunit [Comamonas aquatica]